MRLDIAERLRCPVAHVATPLVIVATRTVERDLMEGVAGCMICHREAVVRAGDVIFPGASEIGASAARVKTPTTADSLRTTARPATDGEGLDRLMALLGLAEPGGAVLLTGRYGLLAAALSEAVEVHVVVWNAEPTRGAGVSVVRLAEPVVPFSDNTFRAAALDADTPLPVLLDAVRVLQIGGRLVGAMPLERPHGVRELARDTAEWVGEREPGPAGVVRIERR